MCAVSSHSAASMPYRAAVLAIAVGVSACGTKDAATSIIPGDTIPRSPTITPAAVTLQPSDTFRFRVEFPFKVTPTPVIRWSSSDTSVVAVDSLGGLVRARTKGVITITARVQLLGWTPGAAVVAVGNFPPPASSRR